MTGGYQAQVIEYLFLNLLNKIVIILKVRSVPPLFTRLITIGADPYCNFYYCAEVNFINFSLLKFQMIFCNTRVLKCHT
jgi:hypothetical protein